MMPGTSEIPPNDAPTEEGPPHEIRDCISPETKRSKTLRWTINECATFAAVPQVVTEEGLPPWNTERGNLLSQGRIRHGDAMLRTLFPVRMNGTDCPPWNQARGSGWPQRGHCDRTRDPTANPNGERCHFAGGSIASGEDGEMIGVFGVNPEPYSNIKNKTASCGVVVMTAERIALTPWSERKRIREGEAVLIGGNSTPMTTEAIFHSTIIKCGRAPM